MREYGLISILLSGTLLTWGWLIYRRSRGASTLPPRPSTEPVLWGPLHVLGAIAASFFIFPAIAQVALISSTGISRVDPSLGERASLQMAISLAGVVAACISLWFIRLTTGTTLSDIGINLRPFRTGILFGLFGFFCFAFPSYLLNHILQLLDERIHPVVEMLRESQDMQFFTSSCISVIILSPLYEEIICRVILQGWLQAAFSQHFGTAAAAAEDTLELSPAPPTCWRSILLSSLFFAILHAPAGWASVGSLFLFAIGLGLVYQRTGRLLCCIVMHMMLNAFTMLALYLEITA